MKRVLFGLCLLLPISAQAADPQCANPWSGTVYNAVTGTVKFCSPTLDIAGATLPVGSLSKCDLEVAGSIVSVPVADPGKYLVATAPVAATWTKSFTVVCYSATGVKGLVLGPTVGTFPEGKLTSPTLIP